MSAINFSMASAFSRNRRDRITSTTECWKRDPLAQHSTRKTFKSTSSNNNNNNYKKKLAYNNINEPVPKVI